MMFELCGWLRFLLWVWIWFGRLIANGVVVTVCIAVVFGI